MPWFRQPDVPKNNKIVAEIEERNLQHVHDHVDECLTKFCKEMGMMPKDVRHRLVGYHAERKRWKRMNMNTIYKFHNDPDKLSLMIHLDTRMTKEEEDMIDAMTMDELVTFCNYENHKKLSQFFKEHAEMTSEELAARAKHELRLSPEEIKTVGLSEEEINKGGQATYANMTRYWCKVRPEAFTTHSRADLMRLYKE